MKCFKVLLQLYHKILVIGFKGEIFFTLHTTVIQQICSTFSVIEQSMHKTPPVTLQKTNSRNTSIYKSIYGYVKIMKNVREVRFPHILIIYMSLMKIQNELTLFHWGVIIFQHNPTAPWCTFLIFAQFLQLPQNTAPPNSTADKHTCHSNSQCSCPCLLWPMLIAAATVLLVIYPDKLTFITLISLRSLSAAGNTQYVCQLHTPTTSHLVIPVSCSPFTVITLHICYIMF